MTHFKLYFLGLMLISFTSTVSHAQPSKENKHINTSRSGTAIQGYDPVSYFTEQKAVEGMETYKHTYQGATYFFKNSENLARFKDAPEAFAPKYGGWCAYAMGVDGSKVKIDPETFKIVDGGLYLFYNFRFTNTLPKWNGDEANLKPKADDFWNKIISR